MLTRSARPLTALLLLLSLALCLFACGKPETQAGTKTITVDIVTPTGTTTKTITTEAEYLRGALDQESLVAGDEGEYGLFVKTAGGYTVDETKQEWWALTKGGETLFSSVDTTPIADGDHFELTLTVGW